MTSATLIRTVTVPQVNLLPPEIGERRRFRRVQAGMGAAVLAAIALVALMYVLAGSGIGAAEDEVAVAQADSAQLTARVTELAPVRATFGRAASAQGLLIQALGAEVRWSEFLNELSLTIPADVSVKNMTVSSSSDETVTPGTAGASTTGTMASNGKPVIATITFTGDAVTHDNFAAFLDALAKQKGYADPYFSSSTKQEAGEVPIFNYSSTVLVTSDALSGRYTKPAGG